MNFDRIGQKLEVGDEVIYLKFAGTSASLERGLITGFTKCFVKLCVHHSYRQGEYEDTKAIYDKVMKIPEDMR